MHRRLPVYLLIDSSESMIGDGISAVRSGLSQMITVLRQDPHALETAWLSVISFGAKARVLTPLTEVTEVQEPTLTLGQGTSLGAALDLLAKQVLSEVRRATNDSKGDFRPMVILLTDGQPTDDWEAAKKRFDKAMAKIVSNFYVVGCGQAIDFKSLAKISDIVLSLPDMTPESMRKLFVWMTQTVSTASVGTRETKDEIPGIEILPKEITRVSPSQRDLPQAVMQVFLPGICSHEEGRYVMRYVKDENTGSAYHAKTAHVLEAGEIEEGSIRPPSGQEQVELEGVIACPYCRAQGWIQCGSCGIHYCTGTIEGKEIVENMQSTCPNCKETLTLYNSDSFGADFSRG